ncbi:MAG: TonB family protein [Thermoanaerobaculia bacterium]|nr:TonB family protein [Thermoanaerobaculia bacterium]
MFDTSLVRSRAVVAPQRVTLVAISIGLHSAIAAAVVFAAIASVEFPNEAPDQIAVFRAVTNPPPPPPPPAGPPKAKLPGVVIPKQPLTAQPAEPTPPLEIPDQTPVLEPSQGNGEQTTGEPGGQPGGEPGGVPGGTPGGTGESLEPGVPANGGLPYQPGGEIRSARILQRVEPAYPRAMIGARLQNVIVTVRCVIDKNGRSRDAKIIRSSYPPFNAAVLDALEKWTFAAGTRHGQPVDTWFELTVRFNVR